MRISFMSLAPALSKKPRLSKLITSTPRPIILLKGGAAVRARFFLPVLVVILLFAVDIFLAAGMALPRGFFFADGIFRGRVSVVCVWADSEPARGFLAELAAMEVPRGVQIVGVAARAEDLAVAKKIAPSVPQIVANGALAPILSRIKIAPTTLFVDARGRLIGQAVSGAELDLVRRELARVLELDSPKMRAARAIQSAVFR